MRSLRLTIKEPGTLLSKLFEQDISPEQYANVVRILTEPHDWVLVNSTMLLGPQRKRIGFEAPALPEHIDH